MGYRTLGRVWVGTWAFCALTASASLAAAQQPAPAAAPPLGAQPPPPPGMQPAPPGMQPAPPGMQPAPPPPGYAYPPPPGYAYPPPPPGYYPGYYPAPSKAPPATLSYDGGPIPAGYHVEEHMRRGLVVAGPILVGAPWMLGLLIASADNYSNSSGWLAVPVLGPWITLASRHRNKCDATNIINTCDASSGIDSEVQTLLVFDGLMQGAGLTMLIVGIASPKKVLQRDAGARLHLTPVQIGRAGYGAMLTGEF